MEATMLDARKLARIRANRDRVCQGRTTTVTLVYNKPEGTIYQAANVVWQYQHYADPIAQEPSAEGTPSAIHVRAECPITLDPTQISYIADTPTATAAGVAAAHRYEIVSYRKAGIVANRWTLHLRRMR
jgi:hypothetical protein